MNKWMKVLNGEVLADQVKNLPEAEILEPPANADIKGQWMLVEREADPAFDPEAQKLGPVQRRVETDKVIEYREVLALTAEELAARAKAKLAGTDQAMARVVEDLVSVLVAKGLIALADLPQAAQAKIAERQALRGKI